MRIKYLVLISLLGIMAVFLGGCATGLTASSWPGMTTDANNVYIAGGPHIYAVNLQTGVEVWRFPAKAATATPFYATPSLTPDGQLIVGSFDHKIYSLNPQSGVQNWVFELAKDRWIGGVLVTSDTIFATNADYTLYAISFSGTSKWVAPFTADQAIWGSPVSDGTNVFFGTLGRKVYAVDAQTGKRTWVQTVEGAILGSPVMGLNNTLYVGTYGGVLVSLNTLDGTIIEQKTLSSWVWSGLAQDGSNVYAGDANGTLYAFPMTDTSQPWTQQLNGSIISSPLTTAGKVIVGTEAGNVYFMDNNGQNIRSVSVVGEVFSNPIAAGDLVLVAPTGSDVLLVALDQNGVTKWSFTPTK
jgi:eukaryotic-like serine/threonine-protein kinase